MTNNNPTNPPASSNDARLQNLLAQFGPQAAPLEEILKGFIVPLQDEVAKLRQEKADLGDELAAIKQTGSFTLRPADIAALGVSIASSVTSTPKDKLEAVTPTKFEGKPDKVDSFLSAANLYFALKPNAFSNETQKLLWLLQLFTGAAEPWARAKVESILAGTSAYSTYVELEKDIRTSFSNVSRREEARHNLQSMKYAAKEGLSAFVNRFRPEADASKFSDDTLVYFLRRCLPESIQVQVASVNQGKVPEEISEWYRLCQLLDSVKASAQQISQFPASRTQPFTRAPTTPVTTSAPQTQATPSQPTRHPDAMDVDGHRPARTCYKCGEVGHIARFCNNPSRQFLRAADVSEMMEKAVKAAVEKHLPKKEDFQDGQQ